MAAVTIIERDPRGLGRVVNWSSRHPLVAVVAHYRDRGMRLTVQDGRIIAKSVRVVDRRA